MKKLLNLGICVIIVLSIPIVTSSTQIENSTVDSKNPDAELSIFLLGSLRHFTLPMVGYGIYNIGDEIANDIVGTITIEGGIDDSIYYTVITEFEGAIPPGYSIGHTSVRPIKGFGLVTITVSAESSNAADIIETAKGFQIGHRTIIFG